MNTSVNYLPQKKKDLVVVISRIDVIVQLGDKIPILGLKNYAETFAKFLQGICPAGVVLGRGRQAL